MRKHKAAFIFFLAAFVLVAIAGVGLSRTPRAHAQAVYGITPTAEPAPTDPPPPTEPPPTQPPPTQPPSATSAPAPPTEVTPEPMPVVLPVSGAAQAPHLPLVLLVGLALVLSGLLALKSNPGESRE